MRGARPKDNGAGGYDPFACGEFPVGVRTLEALDSARQRRFPCEIWYPAAAIHRGEDVQDGAHDAVRDASARAGLYPVVVFSHGSGGGRRQSTFLCTHLASHGYVVAALDHSETVAPELARRDGEAGDEKAARVRRWMESRPPDISFLLDYLLGGAARQFGVELDAGRVATVGHSLGGWTVLAALERESRIGAVVALAPAGSRITKPGIIPAQLTFAWKREVATLYLGAENDVCIPLAALHDLFERTPGAKRLWVLRRADHLHFMDRVEQAHEAIRATVLSEDLAWIPKEMRPMAELSSGDLAHLFTRGLTTCHLDAELRGIAEARRWLADDMAGKLARRGVDAFEHRLAARA